MNSKEEKSSDFYVWISSKNLASAWATVSIPPIGYLFSEGVAGWESDNICLSDTRPLPNLAWLT